MNPLMPAAEAVAMTEGRKESEMDSDVFEILFVINEAIKRSTKLEGFHVSAKVRIPQSNPDILHAVCSKLREAGYRFNPPTHPKSMGPEGEIWTFELAWGDESREIVARIGKEIVSDIEKLRRAPNHTSVETVVLSVTCPDELQNEVKRFIDNQITDGVCYVQNREGGLHVQWLKEYLTKLPPLSPEYRIFK